MMVAGHVDAHAVHEFPVRLLVRAQLCRLLPLREFMVDVEEDIESVHDAVPSSRRTRSVLRLVYGNAPEDLLGLR